MLTWTGLSDQDYHSMLKVAVSKTEMYCQED